MLAELKFHLKTESDQFGVYQSSNMQGILMENIDAAYAEHLHSLNYNPYSQAILGRTDKDWVVRTLTKEAYDEIILPLKEQKGFEIKKKEIYLQVTGTELKQKKKQELLDEFYNGETERYVSFDIQTPTSFKRNGRYVILPTVRLLFQSLMNKYSASFVNMEMFDEDALMELEESVEISDYRIRSCFFSMEGIRIPSFMGNITLRSNGSDTLKRYMKMLLCSGEYSGVGIKSSMGMGAIKLRRKDE